MMENPTRSALTEQTRQSATQERQPWVSIRPEAALGRFPTLGKLVELQHWRHLLYFLVQKELKIKYKYASLGFLWAIIYPLAQMMIFALVFSFVLRFGVENYPSFLLSGLVPWTFFLFSLGASTSSIEESAGLIKKIRFPREILPLAKVVNNLTDFLVSLVVLLVFLLISGIGISRWIVLLPLAILVELLFTCGVCLLVAALTVLYRDVQYVKDLTTMFLFYASPILYPVSMIPESLSPYLPLYYLNPIAGMIHLFRSALYDHHAPSIPILVYTSAISLAVFWLGLRVFRRQERSFADLI